MPATPLHVACMHLHAKIERSGKSSNDGSKICLLEFSCMDWPNWFKEACIPYRFKWGARIIESTAHWICRFIGFPVVTQQFASHLRSYYATAMGCFCFTQGKRFSEDRKKWWTTSTYFTKHRLKCRSYPHVMSASPPFLSRHLCTLMFDGRSLMHFSRFDSCSWLPCIAIKSSNFPDARKI